MILRILIIYCAYACVRVSGSCARTSLKRSANRALLCGAASVRYFPFVPLQFSKLRSDFNSGLYSNAGVQRAILRRNFASHRQSSFQPKGNGSVCTVWVGWGSNRKYIVTSSISQLKFSRPRRFFPTFTIVPAFYRAARRSSKGRICSLKGCKSLRHVIN